MRKFILLIAVCMCFGYSPVILCRASEDSETQSVAEQPAESDSLAAGEDNVEHEEVDQASEPDIQEEESANTQESHETEENESESVQESQEINETEEQTADEGTTEGENETEQTTEEETEMETEEDTKEAAIEEMLQEQYTEYVQLLSDTVNSDQTYDDTELIAELNDLNYWTATLCLLVAALLLYLIIHNILKGNK